MDATIAIDPGDRIARIRVVGTVNLAEVGAMVPDFVHHPDFQPGIPLIWDFRDAELGQWSTYDLRAMGEQNRQLSERRGNAKVALVVQGDLPFGVARMHQVMGAAPNLEFRIYRDMGNAEAWIREERA